MWYHMTGTGSPEEWHRSRGAQLINRHLKVFSTASPVAEEWGGRTAESVTAWSDSVGVENCSSLAQGLIREVTYALFSPQNIGLCNVVFFFKNECLILKKIMRVQVKILISSQKVGRFINPGPKI